MNRCSGTSSGAVMGHIVLRGCRPSVTRSISGTRSGRPGGASKVETSTVFLKQEERMSGSVIVAGARTPVGRLLGGLKDLSAADLGGVAIKGALEKAGVSGDQVDYVIMGQVIQAGAGQITARQASVKAGIPMTTPAI